MGPRISPYLDNFYISQLHRTTNPIIGKTIKLIGYPVKGELSKEITIFAGFAAISSYNLRWNTNL